MNVTKKGTVFIYCFYDDKGQPVYVGQTTDYYARYISHLRDAIKVRGPKRDRPWFQWIRRELETVGHVDTPEILEMTFPSTADIVEEKWMERLRDEGANLLNGLRGKKEEEKVVPKVRYVG